MKKYRLIKLLSFFAIIIFMILYYCFSIPTKDNGLTYQIQLIGIIYIFIIMFSVLFINIKDIDKKNFYIALFLGFTSVFVSIPLNMNSFLSGICTFFAYLSHIKLSSNNQHKMRFLNRNDFKNNILNFSIVLITLSYFLITIVTTNEGSVITQFNINNLLTSISASISEEIIFRMFLYSVLLYVCEYDVHEFMFYLIMVVPFALLHGVDQAVNYGIYYMISYVLNLSFILMILTVLAKKRGVLIAIVVHFLYDFIIFTFR